MRTRFVWIVAALFFGTVASAFALNKHDEQALKDTQRLLSDDAAIQAFAKDNKDAQGALKQVDDLTKGDPKKKAEINEIASRTFANMIKANNGDNAATLEQLQVGLKDPAAFLKTMSPEDQARIKAMAAEIDKQNANRGPASVTK